MEDRITELETKMTHQEKMIDELNDVVIQQGKEIEALKVKARVLKESMSQQLLKNEEDETPPPHY